MSAADADRIMALEAALAANPNQYDAHAEYVELLRRCRLRARARAAREAMAARFPLNEAQWRAWLADEAAAARAPADLEFVKALHERAVRDYLSVDLWADYLGFLAEIDREAAAHTPAGVAAFREAAERALQAGGLHLSEGARLWAAFRAYEAAAGAAAAGAAAKAGSGGAAAAAAARQKAAERVRALWHRQLAVPLAGGDALWAEYEAWEAATAAAAAAADKGAASAAASIPDHVRRAADKARQAAALRAAHEAAVARGRPADAALLAAYLAYIKLEQAHGDPARVALLFERAVAAFPVTAELWQQYAAYLERHVKIPAVVDAALARAVRNCPWVGALWARALRAAELGGSGGSGGAAAAAAAAAGAAEERHRALYEAALAAGMQGPEDYMDVLLARADFLRRRIVAPATGGSSEGAGAGGDQQQQQTAEERAAAAAALRALFASASELMAAYFPDFADRALRLPAYWAHCEAFVVGDAPAARAVWEAVLKGPLARYYEPWAAAVQMERALRCAPQARALYRRAWSRRLEDGGQLAICLDWLRFEREEGSAEDLKAAALKVEPVLEGASAAAAAAGDAHALAVARVSGREGTAPWLRGCVCWRRKLRDPASQSARALTITHTNPPFPPPFQTTGRRPERAQALKGGGRGDAARQRPQLWQGQRPQARRRRRARAAWRRRRRRRRPEQQARAAAGAGRRR